MSEEQKLDYLTRGLFPVHVYMQAPRVPFQALAMVVPPQEPDSVPSTIATPPPVTNKGLCH